MKKRTRTPMNIGLPQRYFRAAGPTRAFTTAATVQKNHGFIAHFKRVKRELSAKPSCSIVPFLNVLAQAHHLHV